MQETKQQPPGYLTRSTGNHPERAPKRATMRVTRQRKPSRIWLRALTKLLVMAAAMAARQPIAVAAPAVPADRLVNIGVILDEPAIEAAAGEALDPRRYRVIRGVDLRARATAEGIQPGLPPGTRALARSMGLSGIIGGVIRNQGDKVSAFIVLSDGASGEIVARARWTATNTERLAALVRRELWKKLGPSVRALITVPGATIAPQPPAGGPPLPGAGAPPPPPAQPAPDQSTGGGAATTGPAPSLAGVDPPSDPQPAAATSATPIGSGSQQPVPVAAVPQSEGELEVMEEEEEEPGPVRARSQGRLPLLGVVLGARLHSRTLDYENDPQDALANYRAAVAPGLNLGVSSFPLRQWVPLGVELVAESTARIASELPGDLTYESRNVDLHGSLVLQLASRWLVLNFAAGGGVHRFSFVAVAAAANRPRPVPDVFYRYLRGGLSLRVMASTRFGLEAGAHYRHVLHPGEIRTRDWFPQDKAYAVEGQAAIVYRLTRSLDARLEAQLRRYKHQLNGKPGDARTSDGAVDQHLSAGLALAWMLGAPPPAR